MKLHLVGGFLGSGKTTAIIQAARAGMARGQTVGVITNDQGKYLVDTAFFRLASLPTVEVTGGCFCCNYVDLNDNLGRLIEAAHPDVIFAESVGSCADIVATVVRPLLTLAGSSQEPSSFSVFADARMLRRRLLGLELPFSEDIVYIFDKQIEEAGLLVVNKIDLLSPAEIDQLQALTSAQYPEKHVVFQSALTETGIQLWLERLEQPGLALPDSNLEIDYQRYGRGEGYLAWLDEVVAIDLSPHQDQSAIRDLIAAFHQALKARQAGIGHLKFIIQSDAVSAKISLPALEEPGWQQQIPPIQSGTVRLTINARVELAAAELETLFAAVLQSSGLQNSIDSSAAFHPAQPKPTHRIWSASKP